MTNAQLVVTIILLQQGLVGLMWLGAALIGLQRRSAIHWGLEACLAAVSLALSALRQELSPWVGTWMANTAGMAGAVVMWRGVQLFCGLRPDDRQHLGTVAAFSLLLAVLVGVEAPMHWVVLSSSLGLAWPALRAAADIALRLRFEFGTTVAYSLAGPLALFGGVFLARALLAPLATDALGSAAMSAGPANAVLGLLVLICTLAVHFALAAMAALRMVQQLRHVSDHDALTGVLNRRGFEDVLGRECERLRRYHEGFALLSIDIDHFNKINDRHGHATGDEVLVGVAQELSCGLRDVDRIGCTGGEEFWVLLPHTDQDGADQAAQRLLERVRARSFGAAGAPFSVTVSIGVAVADDARESRNDLLRRVDRALYRAKEAGRDRIETAEPPLRSGVRLATA